MDQAWDNVVDQTWDHVVDQAWDHVVDQTWDNHVVNLRWDDHVVDQTWDIHLLNLRRYHAVDLTLDPRDGFDMGQRFIRRGTT